MKQKYKLWPIFSGLLLILFFIFLALKFSSLQSFIGILEKGKWYLILAMFFVEFLYFYNQTQVFIGLFKIYKSFPKVKEILKIFLASNFTNLAIPSGGLAGLTVFTHAASKINLKKSQAAVVNILFILMNYGAFTSIMILGLVYLFTINKLEPYQYIAALALLAIVFTGFLIFFMGIFNKHFLKKIIIFIIKIVNFFTRSFIKKDVITNENIDHFYKEILYSLDQFKRDPHAFIEPLIFSLTGHLLQIVVLYLGFAAFGVFPDIEIVVIGYIFSVIFLLISPTPSGVGIVEPTMAICMSSLGVTIESATIATLVFRGIVFWMPFFVGFYATRKLKL